MAAASLVSAYACYLEGLRSEFEVDQGEEESATDFDRRPEKEEEMAMARFCPGYDRKVVVPVVEQGERHMYVFLGHDHGQISSSLYRIEVPKLVTRPPPIDEQVGRVYRVHRPREPKDSIDPIIEFPYPAYPREMCCVELKSKLYFLGGHLRDEGCPVYDLPESDFPRTVCVFDTQSCPPTKKKTTTTSPSGKYVLLKGEIPRMKTGKPFPYAFTAKGSIFIYDNSINYCEHRPENSLFEVYQPIHREWKQLPDPPLPSTVCGHALHRSMVFLSCEGMGDYGHVLVFNVKKHVWLQNFIQGFEEGHRFYGEAQLLNDNLYALSGLTCCIPAAYEFKPQLLQRYTTTKGKGSYKNVPFYMALRDTDLFDAQALAHYSMEGVGDHTILEWLSSRLVYLGSSPDHCFCYLRAGQLPDEDYPNYEGIIIDYFVPNPQFFMDDDPEGRHNSFTGQLLHTSQLKIKSANPRKPATLKGCFCVSDKIPNMRGGSKMLT